MKIGDLNKDLFINSSMEELKERWTNKEALRKSAIRRWQLHYQKITFGKKKGRLANILKLLTQLHNTFYLGYFESTCSLAGNLLEQSLIFKLEQLLAIKKEIYITDDNGKRKITTQDEIYNLCLQELILACYQNELFLEKRMAKLAHDIRKIRNYCVHAEMPLFTQNKNEYVLKISTGTQANEKENISLPENEVKDLTDNIEQLTPYYCVTRVRQVLGDLFN